MSYNQPNNDLFSYQGTINRKNYIINILIVIALFVGISLVHFENFAEYVNPNFLYSILLFMVDLFKFVILMSAISLVYRRIADFSNLKYMQYNVAIKKIFFILFVFPVIYIFCLRFFIDIIPIMRNFLDFVVFFILIPFSIFSAFILAFIKGNK